MKYFTYELISAANGWSGEDRQSIKMAQVRLEKASRSYDLHLDRLRERIGARAFDFFRNGIMSKSLHDATLIRMTTGDDIKAGTRSPLWYRNSGTTSCLLEFLNCDGDLTRIFRCSGVRRLTCNLFVSEPMNRNLGDLFIYELRAMDHNFLVLGFLFASGAEIEIEFRKLQFRTRRHS